MDTPVTVWLPGGNPQHVHALVDSGYTGWLIVPPYVADTAGAGLIRLAHPPISIQRRPIPGYGAHVCVGLPEMDAWRYHVNAFCPEADYGSVIGEFLLKMISARLVVNGKRFSFDGPSRRRNNPETEARGRSLRARTGLGWSCRSIGRDRCADSLTANRGRSHNTPMGEIIRNVRLQAVTQDGDAAGPEVVVSGIIDSGTSSLIISSALARTLRAHLIEDGTIIEDAHRTVAILRAAIVSPRCGSAIAIAVVDDELASRAGFDPVTGEPQVRVGHDLLQSSRARLRFAKPVRGRPPRDTIECEDPPRGRPPRGHATTRTRTNPIDDWRDRVETDEWWQDRWDSRRRRR